MKPVMTAAIKTHAPDDLRAFAYNIFYVVMNLGAFSAGHIVSYLRRSLLGRVFRPSDWFDGLEPASDAAHQAFLAPILQGFPSFMEGGARYGVEAFGKRVTGGRQIEFWTEADMVSIQNAASSVLDGQVLPAAPVGFSGYEMIYVVATVLSVVSFLLVRWMHADPVDPTQEQFEGSTWTDHGRAFKHLMKRSYDIGVGLLKEPTFRAYMLFISVLVLVRAIFVHAHSTWPTYMIREFGADVPQAALWSLNPLLIIFLTPVIGSLTSKFSSWNVIITGSFITAASVLFMVVPGPLEVVARARYLICLNVQICKVDVHERSHAHVSATTFESLFEEWAGGRRISDITLQRRRLNEAPGPFTGQLERIGVCQGLRVVRAGRVRVSSAQSEATQGSQRTARPLAIATVTREL